MANCWATASTNGEINLWDVPASKRLATLDFADGTKSVRINVFFSLSFTANSKTLVMALGTGQSLLWDIDTANPQRVTKSLTPLGLGIGADRAKGVGKVIENPEFLTMAKRGGTYSVTFSPDGNTFALARLDGAIDLIDLRAGKLTATLPGHAWRVCSVAFSPDGKTLASATDDGTIKLWDSATGKNTATHAVENPPSKDTPP
jgi:WD40 repeat protein